MGALGSIPRTASPVARRIDERIASRRELVDGGKPAVPKTTPPLPSFTTHPPRASSRARGSVACARSQDWDCAPRRCRVGPSSRTLFRVLRILRRRRAERATGNPTCRPCLRVRGEMARFEGCLQLALKRSRSTKKKSRCENQKRSFVVLKIIIASILNQNNPTTAVREGGGAGFPCTRECPQPTTRAGIRI